MSLPQNSDLCDRVKLDVKLYKIAVNLLYEKLAIYI